MWIAKPDSKRDENTIGRQRYLLSLQHLAVYMERSGVHYSKTRCLDLSCLSRSFVASWFQSTTELGMMLLRFAIS